MLWRRYELYYIFKTAWIQLQTAVINKSLNILHAADSDFAKLGWVAPGKTAAHLQGSSLWALRGARAACEQQGRVHLYHQDIQVCIDRSAVAASRQVSVTASRDLKEGRIKH